MIEIELKNVKKNYGLNNVLDGFNFCLKTGERVALIGMNGAGKSTLLRLIDGTEKIDSGSITIRKGAQISRLQQIYEKEEESLTVEEFMKRSFAEFIVLEEKMRELEVQMKTELGAEKIVAIENGKLKEYMGNYEDYVINKSKK